MMWAGLAGAGLGALMGSQTPDYSGAARDYGQTLNQVGQQFNPYIQQGFAAQQQMQGLGKQAMADPAHEQNLLAQGFQTSPYQQQIMQNTRNQMNMNAAQTGMLGSTSQMGAMQNQMAGMQNQFQQQYIDRGLQQYDIGQQNLQNLGMLESQQGFGATRSQAELGSQAALARMQGAEMGGKAYNMFGDALGGAIGMMKAF